MNSEVISSHKTGPRYLYKVTYHSIVGRSAKNKPKYEDVMRTKYIVALNKEDAKSRLCISLLDQESEPSIIGRLHIKHLNRSIDVT